MLQFFLKCSIIYKHLGVAQFGSAQDWGSWGRWFKSSHSDHTKNDTNHENYAVRVYFCKEFLGVFLQKHPLLF